MLVLDGSMNLDLAHELLLGAAPLQRAFQDDLGRRNCFRVALNEFVTLSKTAFAQKLSLGIFPVADLTI